jgi:hypothetical protein
MVACVHGAAAEIKIMGEPSLVFIGMWFGFFRLSSEIYKIISWKKKEYEDLKDLLVSFRCYFVIDEDSLCISTMYYLFHVLFVSMNICGIDCQKKKLVGAIGVHLTTQV